MLKIARYAVEAEAAEYVETRLSPNDGTTFDSAVYLDPDGLIVNIPVQDIVDAAYDNILYQLKTHP